MADLSNDMMPSDDIAGIAARQLQIAKASYSFRVNEDKKYIAVYSSMYTEMLQKLTEEEKQNAETIAKLQQEANEKSQKAMQRYRKMMSYQMSAEERAAALSDAKAKKEAEIEQQKSKYMEEIAMAHAKFEDGAKLAGELAKIESRYRDKEIQAKEDIKRLDDEIAAAEYKAKVDAATKAVNDTKAAKDKAKQDCQSLQDRLNGEGSFMSKVEATRQFLAKHPLKTKIDVAAAMEKNEKAQDNYQTVNESKNAENAELKKLIEAQTSILNDPTKSEEEKQVAEAQIQAAKEQIASNNEMRAEAAKQANAASVEVAISKLQEAIAGAYKNATAKAETILNDYQGVIDGRMQGSDKNFKKMADTVTSTLATSPYVKTTQVLEKLKEASEMGLSYNTEQRAFLAEISEKIANTFDAFDSNLLRIIRLQQADTTATRLGMEASLTKLFNSMFQDSSYLKNVSDSITGAIVDATSQLSYEASAEFEYVVQKWLGALSSLGMSDNSLTQIATGLNYLATGDVTNLSNNSALQTLFAMSAARSENLEYSEILLNGLDASKTNELLANMIIYLKEIAENSDNQVVKAAYGDIFSMSLSDMKAISNLTTKEISTLSKTNMSYSDMKSEVDNQMNQLWNRTSIAAMMTNVFDNVIYSVASDMTNNPVTFAMQKMLNFMDETKTDINIPFINAMGFGLDVNASVKDLMQMGLGIAQAFRLTGNILSGLSSGGGTNLDAWGATETTKRGAGLNLTSGSTLGTYAASGNSSDVKNSTMSSATDDSEESKKITNKNSKAPENTMDDLMKAVVGVDASDYVLTQNSTIEKVYDSGSDSLKVMVSGLTMQDGVLKVKDDKLIELVSKHLTDISNYMTTSATKTVSVTIADIPNVAIDKDMVIDAVRSALYNGDSSKNFSDMIEKIVNGELAIASVRDDIGVKTNAGVKLQVSNLTW